MRALPQEVRKVAALLAVLLTYLGTWCELNHCAFHRAAVERAQRGADTVVAFCAPDPACPLCELEATPCQLTVAPPCAVPVAWLPTPLPLPTLPALLPCTSMVPPCGRGPPTQSFLAS